ncbi:MAG: type II toxin-antitoxin system PemK/MazF family toxin [Thermodesulfobacteriota bacterium]
MRRGEIWWGCLREPRGSEPGYRRPLLIVQADAFNRSRLQTVLAAVITSNVRLADAPGNVLLPAKTAGLPRASVVNVSRLVTVDKGFLVEKAGRLTPEQLGVVEDGLRLVLSL